MGSSTYGGFGLASETMRRVTEDITGITGHIACRVQRWWRPEESAQPPIVPQGVALNMGSAA